MKRHDLSRLVKTAGGSEASPSHARRNAAGVGGIQSLDAFSIHRFPTSAFPMAK